MGSSAISKKSFAVFLFAYLLANIILLVKFPFFLERPQYFTYAKLLLNSTEWLHSLDFNNCVCGDGPSDITTYRAIGYPFIVATFKVLFGTFANHALITFQLLLWSYSALLLTRLSDELKINAYLKWILFISYLFGWGAFLQHDLATDGIFASIFGITIIYYVRTRHKEENDLFTAKFNFCFGILILGLALIREVIFIIFPIFLLVYFADLSRFKRIKLLLTSAKAAVVTALPILIWIALQVSWNFYRSEGHAFLFLGSRTSLTPRIEHAMVYKPSVINNSILYNTPALKNNILDQIEELHPPRSVAEFTIDPLTKYIQREQNLTEFEITNRVSKEYFRLWKEHPVLLLQLAMEDVYFFKDFMFIFNPIVFIRNYHSYYNGMIKSGNKIATLRDIYRSHEKIKFSDILIIIAENFFRLVSLIIYGYVLFYLLHRTFIARSEENSSTAIPLSLIAIQLAYIAAFSAVHIEMRYLAATMICPQIAAALLINNLIRIKATQ